jgi:hypothetical protein
MVWLGTPVNDDAAPEQIAAAIAEEISREVAYRDVEGGRRRPSGRAHRRTDLAVRAE